MTIGSVFMTLEALKKIKNTISAINPAYVAHIQPKALVTLIVEHFNSKMREVCEVPTVMQFAYQFPDAVEETVKRTTTCGFSYFTNRDSYYEVAEDMVLFESMAKVPRPTKIPGNREDVLNLRKWAKEYGKATRQLGVRGKSTKDNPGTLPISAYGRRTLDRNPLTTL